MPLYGCGMDPATTSILLGVVGDALWTFLLRVGKDVASLASVEREVLDKAVEGARVQLLESTRDFGPDDELIAFASSAEAEGLVRQLFGYHLVQDDVEGLRQTFIDLGRTATGDRVAVGALNRLFDLLGDAALTALTALIDDPSVAAHDAKSSLQFRLLRDEVRAIGQSLQTAAPDLAAITAFEAELREHVETATRHIVPPYLDALRRVPINDLYVSPLLQSVSDANAEHLIESTDQFLSNFHRSVVLGHPGGGKSTLAQKLAYDVATRRGERLVAGRDVTPAVVLLRDFGARHKESPISLRDFLEMQATTVYQLSPPAGAFEHLLAQGRIMLILDGLDELIDTTYRRAITVAVEHFSVTYPAVPMLVTSREVGYRQAPLDEDAFATFRLSHFSSEQASEYVRRWFDADTTLEPPERERLVAAFDGESASVPDLRENPLMLGLLCNIYRGENWIPRNRPDVYEKCALMLFERWDRQRGIVAFDAFESHLRPAMEYLAHWIFSNQERQAGVGEAELVDAAALYLHEHRYADQVEATHAAREFIQFCRGRAWVFTDTGTRPSGERLFQFTHRTFLEYFTAVHLSRTHALPSELLTTIRPRIASGEWDVVSQLVVQIKNRAIEGAADELLLGLVPRAGDGAESRLSLAGFIARTLGFLVPKPTTTSVVTRAIVIAIIDACILEERQAFEESRRRVEAPTGSTLQALVSVGVENAPTVIEVVDGVLRTELQSESTARRAIAAEFILNPLAPTFTAQNASQQAWEDMTQRALDEQEQALISIGCEDAAIAYDLFWRGVCDAGWYVAMHGTTRVFMQRAYRIAENVRRISLFHFVAEHARFAPYRCSLEAGQAAQALSTLGRELVGETPPWSANDSYSPASHGSGVKVVETTMDGHALFAYALAACMWAERSRAVRGGIEQWSSLELPDVLTAVAELRGQPLLFEARRAELVDLGLGDDEIDMLASWAAETITFTASTSE
jgi:hypothetical protein